MHVAYLGPHGTFSEEAAMRYFAREEVTWTVCQTIPDVLEAVQRGDVTYGMVPIENSIDGSVTVALDGIFAAPELFVCGEFVLPVQQMLLGLPETNLADVREIWSIPPALAQCRQFLHRHGFPTRHFSSTAAAAKEIVASGRTDVAAIASAFAAKTFGLSILHEQIQDADNNHTRFVIVRKGQVIPANADKTMLLVLPCAEYAGILATILNVFAAFHLNLSWISSRPTKTRLGTYQFAFDVEAGLEDPKMQKAISILRTFDHQVRIVGTFPAWKWAHASNGDV
ncbi:prephenate dehydratase [Alicyclobacillus contaminans]|uniref:prephenate dehydratase n=1 Tax=Alicyclobacillus contaminans TaxID=392016 RepID=UPI00041600E0|nr:prephenate dehydratase [Alicyclobacillus contaminans]GMA49750.1 prephenate dehydratase [Alicyclobacillus contaminans]